MDDVVRPPVAVVGFGGGALDVGLPGNQPFFVLPARATAPARSVSDSADRRR